MQKVTLLIPPHPPPALISSAKRDPNEGYHRNSGRGPPLFDRRLIHHPSLPPVVPSAEPTWTNKGDVTTAEMGSLGGCSLAALLLSNTHSDRSLPHWLHSDSDPSCSAHSGCHLLDHHLTRRGGDGLLPSFSSHAAAATTGISEGVQRPPAGSPTPSLTPPALSFPHPSSALRRRQGSSTLSLRVLATVQA